MYILGISAFYHDSAACLIFNGKIIAAVQEERFTRIKHDSSFPTNSIKYCLKAGGINGNQINYVVFYEKPFVKFERLLETYFSFAPKGFLNFKNSLPKWIKINLFQKNLIIKELKDIFDDENFDREKLLFTEHHLSHASSAFFPSPFEESAVLTLDGVGEWTTSSIALGKNNNLNIVKEISFPHSIGLLYSAFTYYLGFKVNSGEYKVMGLAPYGEPKYINTIKDNLIEIKNDGSFFLNMKYFDYCTNLRMTNSKFDRLFGGPPRSPESEIEKKHLDIAASIQKVTEDVVINICKNIAKDTGQKNLCLAGGVALNCVANGEILRKKIFKNIWVQPASGDAGGALGAALACHYIMLKNQRYITENKDFMEGSYLGPSFSDKEIEKTLQDCGSVYKRLDENKLIEAVANFLIEGKAVGWMQGKMEYGPRALGNRSILADPRSPTMQKQLNLKIKKRESFRPFAPSIIFEEIENWFEICTESSYMQFVTKVKSTKIKKVDNSKKSANFSEMINDVRSLIPAVTHVDNSSRIQTVTEKSNPLFYNLIDKFKSLSDVPILVNTSFNVRGEPIVCSPIDAIKCFMKTEIEILVIGNYILEKKDQSMNQSKFKLERFKLD